MPPAPPKMTAKPDNASRDVLAERVRFCAVQIARMQYGILRTEQIVIARENAGVDSNYYYRQYMILTKKINKAAIALRKLRKNLSGWQTNQAHGSDKYTSAVDDILEGINGK